jgi:hypothetical protein
MVMRIYIQVLHRITKLYSKRLPPEDISISGSENNDVKSYLESEECMEVIDLVKRRKEDLFLLGCARKLFPCAEVIIPVPDLPSMIISREGGLIAYGWVNEKGHAEFKLAVPHAELS